MRKILPWLITLAGCFLVTGALAAVKYQQITAAIAFGASFPDTYEVVSARRVSSMTYTPVRRLGGTIRRPEFVEISSEVGGRIVSLPFSAGAVVEKGDAIPKLFSADLVAQQEALRADRNLVITQLGRSNTLREQALIAQGDIDVQEARLSALNAQIKAIDAQLVATNHSSPIHWSWVSILTSWVTCWIPEKSSLRSPAWVMSDGLILKSLKASRKSQWVMKRASMTLTVHS